MPGIQFKRIVYSFYFYLCSFVQNDDGDGKGEEFHAVDLFQLIVYFHLSFRHELIRTHIDGLFSGNSFMRQANVHYDFYSVATGWKKNSDCNSKLVVGPASIS